MLNLGVNIDHIATLRECRKGNDPCLIDAAKLVLAAGADSITVHLREDRRHIQDQDVIDIKSLDCRLNLEIAATDFMKDFALKVTPHAVCIVPEKREELTTEGGLDVIKHHQKLSQVIAALKKEGIQVSLFIDPSLPQIDAAKALNSDAIEIHTGDYANATPGKDQDKKLTEIAHAAKHAKAIGLMVHAGHGLNRENVKEIAKIKEIEELNIGHSIICHALFVGLNSAVSEIKKDMLAARKTKS